MATTGVPGIINPTSVSFEKILQDMLAYAKSKPNGEIWQDWYTHSDGTIIAEWIAGLATFRAYHEVMRVRESQLDQAQLPSSVFNLAFNKGLLVPPATAGEIMLTLTQTTLKSVDIGDFVATIGDYEVYSLEAKTLEIGPDNKLKCVVGRLNEFNDAVPGLAAFRAFKYQVPDEYLGTQLEIFLADNVEVPLLSDPDYLKATKNDFILRRVLPGESRIYIGNGQLGWLDATVKNLYYRVLSYNADLSTRIYDTPTLVIGGVLTGTEVLVQPALDPNKEEVRQIARFYPIDGRIVTDRDYEGVIRKYYGGVARDVYSYNSDPMQHVVILKDDNFGTGAQEAEYLARIAAMVDSKRTMGMPITYHLKNKVDGKSFIFPLKAAVFSNTLLSEINSYLAAKLYQFQKKATLYTSTDLASELSAKFGVKLTATTDESITLQASDFFKEFYVITSA